MSTAVDAGIAPADPEFQTPVGERKWFALAACLAVAGSVLAAVPGRAATPYPGGTWSPPGVQYGVIAEKNVTVPVEGGVLVVDVYRPADLVSGKPAPGPFPVLLQQTPYNGSLGAAGLADERGPGAYFVERGYIFVSADVRGTGRSAGAGEFMSPRDAEDGKALVYWVADDTNVVGSNGTVGLYGCSYLGHTQAFTAGVLPPGSPVKAMIPACTGSDAYRTQYFDNGIPTPAWEGAGLLAGSLLGPTIEAYMVPNYLDSQAGSDDGTAYYDSPFWQDRSHVLDAPTIAEAGIATLLWNGWDDSGFGGIEFWTALQHAHFGRDIHAPLRPGDAVTGKYQLLLGDWGHGDGLDQGVMLQWYDTWLKGERNGMPTSTTTPFHVQERGTGRWLNTDRYPFVTNYTRLEAEGGEVVYAQPDQDGAVLVRGWEGVDAERMLGGPMAQRGTASSTNTDMQLVADLYDVAPDGTTTLITHGSILGSMRHVTPGTRSWSDPDGDPVRPYLALDGEHPLTADEVVTLDIPLQPTLYRLPAGHDLRLVLATQAGHQRCLDKATAITTSAVGCRARAAVLARLAGGRYRIDHMTLSAPLLDVDAMRVAADDEPGATRLPVDW